MLPKKWIVLLTTISFFGLLVIVIFGCASIIKSGPQTVSMTSNPSEARLLIYDVRKGNEILDAKTPYTATLERGAGYFKKAKYKIVIEKEGYKTKEILLEGSPNGWYILGNLVFGGIIGWFIVDPATGSMWTLQPEDIKEDLAKEISFFQQDKGLMIVLTSDLPEIPEYVKQKMKPVNLTK